MEALNWGINSVSHDTSVACVDDSGNVKFAIAEERLSRIKKDDSFPKLSLELVHKLCGQPKTIFIPKLPDKSFRRRGLLLSMKAIARRKSASVLGMWAGKLSNSMLLGKPVTSEPEHQEKLPDGKKINVEHHYAHAASAYYPGGLSDSVVLSLDGMGDFCSGGIYEGHEGILERKRRFFIHEAPYAMDYQLMTAVIGFKPNRHEGKITGLAALGKYNENCIKKVRGFLKAVWASSSAIPELKNISGKHWCNSLYLSTTAEGIAIAKSYRKRYFKEFSDADIAYAIQYLTEKNVLSMIEKNVDNIKTKNIALAGGLFANVKLNQRIKELGFKNIFVQPAMGDDGISYGSVFWELGKQGLKPKKFDNVYFGPGYSAQTIKKTLEHYNLKYKYYEEGVEGEVAELITKGNIIARFDGRMEYGPRALGNRSILYHTEDKTANDWLNKNLNRTEFMPFAPVTLEEEAHRCYKGLEGGEYTAQFMTITFDCTDWMAKTSPAVVHVDGTARPQLINSKINPSYYKILKEYYKMTGIPSLVNTSFNMHEEPIVCSPDDAIRSFMTGNLHYLAIGNFLVKGKNVKIKK